MSTVHNIISNTLYYVDQRTVKLEVGIPTLEDEVMLVVDFVDNNVIEDCSSKAKHISCSMTFMATKPISVSNYIVITDSISGKRYLQYSSIYKYNYVFVYLSIAKKFHFQ